MILSSSIFRMTISRFRNNVRQVPLFRNVKVATDPYQLHLFKNGPPASAELTKEEATLYYKQMFTIRTMEKTVERLYTQKNIRGFCHLYSGQEAICAGMKAAMKPEDCLITGYRCHGWMYMMTSAMAEIMQELTGRVGGCSRGKGGSMHMFAKNYYGGHGIVGAQGPLGTGVAFALKYKSTDGVCIEVHGEGASNQGQFFEAWNIACLLQLPIVYICENNGYGMGTSASRSTANPVYYSKMDAMPGIMVNGQDIVSVREAGKFALEHARKSGPVMMEIVTYRYYGHSMSDPGTSYRSREEVTNVRKTRDPINKFKEKILKSNLGTEAELHAIEETIKNDIAGILSKSLEVTEPSLEELASDVYAKPLEEKVRGVLFDQLWTNKSMTGH